jgi:hypothetical protein
MILLQIHKRIDFYKGKILYQYREVISQKCLKQVFSNGRDDKEMQKSCEGRDIPVYRKLWTDILEDLADVDLVS